MKAKYRIDIGFGGVFSKVTAAVQYLESMKYRTQECYLNVVDFRALNENNFNPLDYVLNQELAEDYEIKKATFLKTYDYKERVEQSEAYFELKNLATSLNYKEKILKLVDRYVKKFNIDENTIGVHVRLCDFNTYHKQDHGFIEYKDYIEEIKKQIRPKSKLFIASDNVESIQKLKKEFKRKVSYVPDMLRAASENTDSLDLQLSNFRTEKLWVEAFLEMLLLSKCSKLICRNGSNLANMAIMSSNTIKEPTMLYNEF